MKVRIQVTIESELRDTPVTEEVACIQREDLVVLPVSSCGVV